MDKLEEIYDQIYTSKRDKKPNKMWEGVDVKDTRPYYRVTSNIEGQELTKAEKDAQKEEIELAVEEIKCFGSNEHFFTTHHQIMM